MLEDLASWVLGGDPEGRQALQAGDLTAALSAAPRSFNLFRRYTDTASRRRFLRHVPYGADIFRTAERYSIDSLLLAAMVEVESGFSPAVVSRQGAVGLMQVLPSTGKMYGVANLRDPAVNLDVGSRYFTSLLHRFGGDLELALAAYNAGPMNVERYGGVPPFPETKSYVDRVLAAYVGNHRNVWKASETGELSALR